MMNDGTWASAPEVKALLRAVGKRLLALQQGGFDTIEQVYRKRAQSPLL